jgi:hypothetical protein
MAQDLIFNHYQKWLQNIEDNENRKIPTLPTNQATNNLAASVGPNWHNFSEDEISNLTKIYENNEFELFIRKDRHKRLRRFRLQDTVYHIQIKLKNPNTSHPLLLNLLDLFKKLFYFILKNLQNFYDKDSHNDVYMAIFQPPMESSLNVGATHLQDSERLKETVEILLSSLYRYLISDNQSLQINNAFKIYFHVLSVDHTKFRQKKVPLSRTKKHYGCSDEETRYAWAINIPKGYPENPNYFEGKCFFISCILGVLQNNYFATKKKDERYLVAQGINRKSLKEKNKAGLLLHQEYSVLCNLINNGNDILSTNIEFWGPIIAQHLKAQIIIFEETSNNFHLKVMYPNVYNDSLQPIYLFAPFNSNLVGHLMFIRDINGYFKFKSLLCLSCKKVSKCQHKCIYQNNCFVCRRPFQKPSTYCHEKLEKNFCDVNISVFSKVYKKCDKCNLESNTYRCWIGHKKFCKGKGNLGLKCDKCQRFTFRVNGMSSKTLELNHKCGNIACFKCGEFYNSLDDNLIHLCPLAKEKRTKFLPHLAFLYFDCNDDICYNCLKLQKDYQTTNNLTYEQLFSDKNFSTLKCELHIAQLSTQTIFYILKEDKFRKGLFSRTIVSLFLDREIEETSDYLFYDYLKNEKIGSKMNKVLKPLKIRQLHFNDSLIHKFLKYLLETSLPEDPNISRWAHTTFLVQDADSLKLVSLLFLLLQ